MGRYAYGNQPRIAQWNLARLAETFLPLLAEDKDAAVKEAQEAIDAFATGFETAYAAGLSRKLGLFQPRSDDLFLAQDLLERMARNGADFTLLFRRLCRRNSQPPRRRGCAQLVYRSQLLRRLGGEMAPSAYRGGWRSERTPGGDARGQPCFHPTQSSSGGGDLRSRERWGFPALRESARQSSPCLTSINRPSAATSIRRGPIKSCTRRFAALDQRRASSTPASRQLRRPGELLAQRFFLLTDCFHLWAHKDASLGPAD